MINGDFSIKSLPSELEKPYGSAEGIAETEGTDTTRRTVPSKTSKQRSYELTETGSARCLHESIPGLLHETYSFQFNHFIDSLNMWMKGSLILVPSPSLIYFSGGVACPNSIWLFLFYIIVFYFVMICCYTLKAYSFLMKETERIWIEE